MLDIHIQLRPQRATPSVSGWIRSETPCLEGESEKTCLSWPWHQGKGKEQLCREFVTLYWSQVAVRSEFILPMWPQKALCVECNLKWFQVGGAPGWLAEANTNPLWRDSGYKEKWKVAMKWSSLEETLKLPCTLRRRKVWDARRNGEQKYC